MLQGCALLTEETGSGEIEETRIFDEIEEAEQIAAYLSDGIEVDRTVMKNVFFDLSLIRGAFGGSVKAINYIYFRPPCTGSGIILQCSEEMFEQVNRGRYSAWDELNARWGATHISLEQGPKVIIVDFYGRYDLLKIAALYEELPGVETASCRLQIGDYPNIYVRETENGMLYLFRDAWGDCPSGCTHEEFYYFVCENDDAIYVGRWNPEERSTPPDWWAEAVGTTAEEGTE
jgi:hypothetical protein